MITIKRWRHGPRVKGLRRSAVIDGAHRGIAYRTPDGEWGEVAYICDACGKDQVDHEEPYWYICPDGYRAPLCYDCVRGPSPDRDSSGISTIGRAPRSFALLATLSRRRRSSLRRHQSGSTKQPK